MERKDPILTLLEVVRDEQKEARAESNHKFENIEGKLEILENNINEIKNTSNHLKDAVYGNDEKKQKGMRETVYLLDKDYTRRKIIRNICIATITLFCTVCYPIYEFFKEKL